MGEKMVRTDEQCQTVARVAPLGGIGELPNRPEKGVGLACGNAVGSQRVSGIAEQVLQPEAVAAGLGPAAASG